MEGTPVKTILHDDMIVTRHKEESTPTIMALSKNDTSNHTFTTEEISESSFSCLSENSDTIHGCTLQNSVTCPQHNLFDLHDVFEVQTTPNRTIRFSDTVKYHEIVHRLEYSPEERSACWYIKDELLAARQEAQDMISLLEESGESSELTTFGADCSSLRGLENLTKKGSKIANQYHRLAIEAVLSEQLEQDLAGIQDDKAIATKYRQISLRCRFPARRRALEDHQNAARKTNTFSKATSSSHHL